MPSSTRLAAAMHLAWPIDQSKRKDDNGASLDSFPWAAESTRELYISFQALSCHNIW